jgi:hypothetical protein
MLSHIQNKAFLKIESTEKRRWNLLESMAATDSEGNTSLPVHLKPTPSVSKYKMF